MRCSRDSWFGREGTLVALVLFGVVAVACDTTSSGCDDDGDCGDEMQCINGACRVSGPKGDRGEPGIPGGAGLNSLLRIEAEPPGDNCGASGQAVHAGLDANRDGELQPGEVSSTAYVCSGETGDLGEAGLDTLLDFEPEPAGERCPDGGQVLEAGLDVDRDGVLQSEEISSAAYVCSCDANARHGLVQRFTLPVSLPSEVVIQTAVWTDFVLLVGATAGFTDVFGAPPPGAERRITLVISYSNDTYDCSPAFELRGKQYVSGDIVAQASFGNVYGGDNARMFLRAPASPVSDWDENGVWLEARRVPGCPSGTLWIFGIDLLIEDVVPE